MWSLILFFVVFVGSLGGLDAIRCNDTNVKPSNIHYKIEYCKSVILRDADTSFRGVVYIGADNNLIKSLDNVTFKDGQSLKQIDLRHNQIVTIQVGTFNNTKNLTHLYLRNNKITNLEAGVFRGLTNLKHLWLQSNQIRILEDGLFQDQKEFKELFFNDNKIVGIGPNVFSKQKEEQKIINFQANICMKIQIQKEPDVQSQIASNCTEFYKNYKHATEHIQQLKETLYNKTKLIKIKTDESRNIKCKNSKSDLDNQSWLIPAMAGEAIVIMGIIIILVVWKCTTLMEGKEFGEAPVQAPASAPTRDDGLIYAELELRGGTSRPPPSPRNDEVIYAGIK
jgi:hypothetical protein